MKKLIEMKTLFDVEVVQKEFDSLMTWVREQAKQRKPDKEDEKKIFDVQLQLKTLTLVNVAQEAVNKDPELLEYYSAFLSQSATQTIENVRLAILAKIDEEIKKIYFSKN